MRKNLLFLLIAFLILPLILYAEKKIQQILTSAAPQPANIIVETKNTIGKVNYSWANFAQGGEEPPPMLSQVKELVRRLSPRYIRIDHIYDSYSVVEKTENGYKYDFSRLDKTVDDILTSGALPFLTLSYMPSVFTSSGSVIDLPNNWDDWKNLVKKTIEHYSGKNNRNLSNVYYEVWNEPELPQFGQWKLEGKKDYRLLYFYAAKGAQEASNVNNFYLGGPAVGSYYPYWVNNFLSYTAQNNLKLDFYSWHRYSKNSKDYSSDAQKIKNLLNTFPQYRSLPLLVTEWGLESENLEINNTNIAASFSLAAIFNFYQNINLAFAFEIKDGPPPQGGKWGLITHEKSSQPLTLKPRYYAFEALTKIKGEILQVSGNGSFVSSIASKNSSEIVLLLTNYDPKGQNTENVPITFTGLDPASYRLKYTYSLEKTEGENEIVTTDGIIKKSFLISPNSLLVIELSPQASLATFIPGPTQQILDQALVLKNSQTPLFFTFPEFHLLPEGKIEFDLRFLFEENDNDAMTIFEAPFSPDDFSKKTLFLRREKRETNQLLSFGISEKDNLTQVSLPILTFKEWQHLTLSWSPTFLFISLNNHEAKIEGFFDIRNGRNLIFYPEAIAIDNLRISLGKQFLERKFDGRIDK